MPLLRKQNFRKPPLANNLRPDDLVFYCEPTHEVFQNYDEFFQRIILCNSLVWSCSITGRSNLTYEEATECESKAKSRLRKISLQLRSAMLWLSYSANRCGGRISDLIDDVHRFCTGRYFIGEHVQRLSAEGCVVAEYRIVRIIPPEIKEIANDELSKRENIVLTGKISKNQTKKMNFSPSEHLFKYEVEEIKPVDSEMIEILIVKASEIQREKGAFNRERHFLFLKNCLQQKRSQDGGTNLIVVKPSIIARYNIDKISFEDFFAGPVPVFSSNSTEASLTSDKVMVKKQQKTLDNWMQSSKVAPSEKNIMSEAEAAKLREIREKNAKYMAELAKARAEEVKKRRIEERNLQLKRRRDEKRLVNEIMNQWKRTREDLECADHVDLPTPTPVKCKFISQELFGEFLQLLNFLDNFSELFDASEIFGDDVFSLFDLLESALSPTTSNCDAFFDILNAFLSLLFELQAVENEEADVKDVPGFFSEIEMNKSYAIYSLLSKDETISKQVQSATEFYGWSMRHQGGLSVSELHRDKWTIGEILRLHILSSGAYRGDRLGVWRYQQRGGYTLTDDPGICFRMEEKAIMQALENGSVFQLDTQERMKVLTCLMNQILTFPTVRDDIDERFAALIEAKAELRTFQLIENRRVKETELNRKRDKLALADKKESSSNLESVAEVHMTERQREALASALKKDEQRMETIRADALKEEASLMESVVAKTYKAGFCLLGRDRAFRRFWIIGAIPGIFVEHNDYEYVGPCLDQPTRYNEAPLNEDIALLQVRQSMACNVEKVSPSGGSDKENGYYMSEIDNPKMDGSSVIKTYSKNKKSTGTNLSHSDSNNITASVMCDLAKLGPIPKSDQTPPFGLCTSCPQSCIVHSAASNRHIKWSFFRSEEELDELIASLNKRGNREHELRIKIISHKKFILKNLSKFNSNSYLKRLAATDVSSSPAEAFEDESLNFIDLSLRDQILELEEKIFFGALGNLKVLDRQAWCTSIQECSYDMQTDGLSWGTSSKKQVVKSSTINDMACAVLQIEQMLETKFLKPPLGISSNANNKKKKVEITDEVANNVDSSSPSTKLYSIQMWEESLMNSTNFAQIFLHMATLENSIIWSKSVMNAKCRLCRRKTDPDKMLLCDGCDRGHHLYCLKPKLKVIPSGDWYCQDCKPKSRNRSPRKASRRVFSVDEEEGVTDDDEYIDINEDNGTSSQNNSTATFSEYEEEDSDEWVEPSKKAKSKSNAENSKSILKLLGKRKVAEEKSEIPVISERSSSRIKSRRQQASEGTSFDPSVLEELLNSLMNHSEGWLFDHPIAKSEAPDYLEVIARPMDLGTIRTQLMRMRYTKLDDVLDDINLVFQNCRQYNLEESDAFKSGVKLEAFYKSEMKRLDISQDTKTNLVSSTTTSHRKIRRTL